MNQKTKYFLIRKKNYRKFLTMRVQFSLLLILSAIIIITTIKYKLKPKCYHPKKQLFQTNSLENKDKQNLIKNIPLIHFKKNLDSPLHFPDFLDLKFTSDFWQTQELTNGTLHLFSSYLDERDFNDSMWKIRITGMFDRADSRITLFCHVWYDLEEIVVQSERFLPIWIIRNSGEKLFYPYIITCIIPKGRIPTSVSLYEKFSYNENEIPTNNLRIRFKRMKEEDRKDFVVCVKGLNFPFEDRSVRLVEWIELIFILGAAKIDFYSFNVHSNMKKVLDFYTEKGKIDVTQVSLIGGASNIPYFQNLYLKEMVTERRLQEVIPYNDCLYKNLQAFKFVVLLDIDEVIVPLKGTWQDLFNNIKTLNATSYMARNVYFFDILFKNSTLGIPPYFHMLRHVYRTQIYTKLQHSVKGFHDVRKVVALHNHFPVNCVKKCVSYTFHTEVAHLQHYRSSCTNQIANCETMKNKSVMDSRLWNYKEQLLARVEEVVRDLGLLNSLK